MGNQPSINASCMFEQNWRFFGVRRCPEDPLRAPLDARSGDVWKQGVYCQ